jgi:hypothetical protein
MDALLAAHVKEGCGISNIVRLLCITKGTAISRIRRLASGIAPPEWLPEGGDYELDEVRTFIGSKANECYLSYAICRHTRKVVDFVGNGSKYLVSQSPRRNGLIINTGMATD